MPSPHISFFTPSHEMIAEKREGLRQSSSASIWWCFSILLLASHSYLLMIDHHPMFFLGDSKSYIATAVTGWLPTDRSFIYGYFIRLIAVSSQSLVALVILQEILLIAASVVLAHLLVRYFRISPWIAFFAAFFTSFEPLQLLFARYVMTETLALLIFVIYVWVILHYLEAPRIVWLCLIHALAVLLISIRFAFIPVTWACAFIFPILALPLIAGKSEKAYGSKMGKWALHVTLSVSMMFAFTSVYKYIHGCLQDKPPAYSYDSGFFAMGFIMPILEGVDFANKKIGEQVLSDLAFPVSDRNFRGAHRWQEGGAVSRLQMIEPQLIKADEIASQAAITAIIHKPFAFVQLGWLTFKDYFDRFRMQSALETLIGNRQLDHDFHNLLKSKFNYSSDQSSALDLKSLSGQYVYRSTHWIQLLLFTPLGWGFLFFTSGDADLRRKYAFIGLISLMLVGEALFLVENPTPRYLHTNGWLFFMMAGIGLDSLLNDRRGQKCS